MNEAGQEFWGAARPRSSAIVRWLCSVALSMISPSLWAATCTVSAGGIAFGGYDPFVNQNVDSVGNVSVHCDVATTYSIALSTGSGSYDSRAMTSSIHRLFYNLYIDATLTTVWGDGTGHSAIVGATQAIANHTVYGRIPAAQNAHVGIYSDTIVVTLTF